MIIPQNMKLRSARIQTRSGKWGTCLVNGKIAQDGEFLSVGDILGVRWDGSSAYDPLVPSSEREVSMPLFEDDDPTSP